MNSAPEPQLDPRDIPTLGGFLRSASKTREERLNPFPWYRQKLDYGPIHWDQDTGAWDVFGYPEVEAVLADHLHFSSARLAPLQQGRKGPTPNILSMDPPRHTSLRRLVNFAFTPKAIRCWGERIHAIVDGLLNDVDHRQDGSVFTWDIVGDLAYPLPVIVIAEMMGIPSSDRERFKEWSDTMVEGPESLEPLALMDLVNRKKTARNEMATYFTEIVDRLSAPSEQSLVALLNAAEVDGEKLTADEIVSFCILLLAAGNETTTNLITNMVRCIYQHPDTWTQMQEDPRLVGGFIEETLRFFSPVQATNRIATENVELFGNQITRGDRVMLWLGAANRDARAFMQPDTFDLHRTPNHHLAFGHGIHFCLGAPLAKLEAEIVMTMLLARYRSIAEVPTDLEPIVSGFVFGVKALPIRVARRT